MTATKSTAPESTDEPTPEPTPEPAAKPSKVKPKVYKIGEWPLGAPAPRDVFRVYDADTSDLGPAQDTSPAPGERAVQVALKGAPITRSVHLDLGLEKR